MAIFERIVMVYNDKGSKEALKDLNKLESSFVNAGKTIAKAFGVAAVAAGALAVKLSKDGVEAAIADQKSQALLANALRNTTGANDAAIASVEEYISAQQRAVAVTDDELRPSLATLVSATKDVAQAQYLQNLALDISAGTQKDLQTVSLALAKAVGGNIGALTKLGVPLSEDIKKSKDLNGALQELSKTFSGAASTRAGTFEGRMTALRISFDQTLETLGYALIPVLEELAQVFQTEILPVFEEFIANNKEEIAETLKGIAKFSINAAKGLSSMFAAISNNLPAFKLFTALLVATFVGTKVAVGVQILINAIKLLTVSLKKQAAAGTAAGIALAFSSAGVSAKAAAVGITAFVVAAGGALYGLNKLTEGFNANSKSIKNQSQVVQGHLKDLERIAQLGAAATGGVVGDFETKSKQDLINEEASRLNLIREGRIEEAKLIAERQKEREAIKATITEAQKYQDILQAISDTKITNEEIVVLAAKWGMTTDAVKSYLAQFFAVVDKKIDKTEIDILAAAWGLTTEQVQKYLDFVNALKDSKLSPEEIAALQAKWGMTVGEIEKYADFVLKVRDFKVTDAEVKALGDAWGLSNEQVLAYLASIGIPFDYNGTFIDPVKGIGTAWTDTKGAVDAYITSLGDADTALATLATNAKTNAGIAETALDSATGAAGELAVAAQGAIDLGDMAMAVAEGARATAALAEAEALAAQGAADAALAAAQAASAAATSFTGLGMAIDPSSFGSNTVTGGIGNGDYESGIFGPNAGQGTTVNVTVQGSVIGQDDLISTVRDGLLAGIGSGLVTTFDPRKIK